MACICQDPFFPEPPPNDPHSRRQPFAEAAGPEPEYEIYAAKYGGPLFRKVAIVLCNVGWNKDGPINYYVWAIKAKNGELTGTQFFPASG